MPKVASSHSRHASSVRHHRPMRIGVLVTSSFSSEIVKDEMLRIGCPNRPWLASTPSRLRFAFPSKKLKQPHAGVTADGAIVSYLLWKYTRSQMTVDAIFPTELTVQKAKQYDIVFMPMCDQLEVNTIFPRAFQERFRTTLKSIPNIFPSHNVQKLINHKDEYYKFFQKKKIPMIDTYVVLRSAIKKKGGIYQVVAGIRRHSAKSKWKRIVVKPTSGQEGLMFTALPENVDDHKLANAIEDILKLYEGVLVQPYIDGFDGKMLENRVYTINEKYAYTMLTNDGEPKLLKSEGGTVTSPIIKEARHLAKRAVRCMPRNRINGIELPHWLLRTDVGYYPNSKRVFMNEMEVVPSLFVTDCPKGIYPEKLLGDGIYRITKKYLHKQQTRRQKPRTRSS